MASTMRPGIGEGAGAPARPARREGRMEPIIDIVAFGIFALLWLAFAAALIWSQGSLDQAWAWFGGLPLIVQGVVGLLFLPVVVGLWIWETAWPEVVRLVLVGGVAVVNLYLFLPRALLGGRL